MDDEFNGQALKIVPEILNIIDTHCVRYFRGDNGLADISGSKTRMVAKIQILIREELKKAAGAK